jgi:hypothetical protein
MTEGVAGLLRDKTRPLRIALLGEDLEAAAPHVAVQAVQ